LRIASVETKTRRSTSPIRLNPMAEKEEDVVKLRFRKVPIRRKLINPIHSQPKRSSNVAAELTVSQTENKNSTNRIVKLRYVGSNSRYEEYNHRPIRDEKMEITRTFHDENSDKVNEVSNLIVDICNIVESAVAVRPVVAVIVDKITRIAHDGTKIPVVTANKWLV